MPPAKPLTLSIVEVPLGSPLYAKSVQLREAILRRPLGLTLSPEELADDRLRCHFCAVLDEKVIGCVSLKPLGPGALQLKQMAVDRSMQGQGIGAKLLSAAEDWARAEGARSMVLHARQGAAGFYVKAGYRPEGEPFEEQTIPHIRMVKELA